MFIFYFFSHNSDAPSSAQGSSYFQFQYRNVFKVFQASVKPEERNSVSILAGLSYIIMPPCFSTSVNKIMKRYDQSSRVIYGHTVWQTKTALRQKILNAVRQGDG